MINGQRKKWGENQIDDLKRCVIYDCSEENERIRRQLLWKSVDKRGEMCLFSVR